MSRQHAGWVLRCALCGEYAMGQGEMAEHDIPFICGQCAVDLDCSLGVGSVDLDVDEP